MKARGGRLGAIVAPTVEHVCTHAQASARSELNTIFRRRDEEPGVSAVRSSPRHYTFAQRGAGRTLQLTGTGLMRGDVLTMTAAEYGASDRRRVTSDFCEKKAAALRRR